MTQQEMVIKAYQDKLKELDIWLKYAVTENERNGVQKVIDHFQQALNRTLPETNE